MKQFAFLCIAIAFVSFEVYSEAPPNEDCSCAGFTRKAIECEWEKKVAECSKVSKYYKNYKIMCKLLNKYRDLKRIGKLPHDGTRNMTCESYKPLPQRMKEKFGTRRPSNYSSQNPVNSVSFLNPSSLALAAENMVDNVGIDLASPPHEGVVPDNQKIATSVNWTSNMTPIKNQGECGSCWAFASDALCEYYLKRKNITFPTAPSISEQYLVDCDFSNYGCRGGWPGLALNFIAASGTPDASYSYKGVQGNCLSPEKYPPTLSCPSPVQEDYPQGNDDRLRQILNVTPVVVAINALPGFLQAQSGIYTPMKQSCDASGINHAVVVVGYGSELGHKYWIVRNSWGTEWGEDGYIKFDANTKNQCGISSYLVYF